MQGERVILFDGVCDLCNGFVRFVIDRDPQLRFRFGTLQSSGARRLMHGNDAIPSDMRTVVYLRNGKVLTRSTGALYILKDLGRGWSVFSVLLIVPTPIRDLVYRIIARYRYRWFGKRTQCMIPSPELRERFLADPEV